MVTHRAASHLAAAVILVKLHQLRINHPDSKARTSMDRQVDNTILKAIHSTSNHFRILKAPRRMDTQVNRMLTLKASMVVRTRLHLAMGSRVSHTRHKM